MKTILAKIKADPALKKYTGVTGVQYTENYITIYFREKQRCILFPLINLDYFQEENES